MKECAVGMMQPAIFITIDAGVAIYQAAHFAIGLAADHDGLVVFSFNGLCMVCRPDGTTAGVVSDYHARLNSQR